MKNILLVYIENLDRYGDVGEIQFLIKSSHNNVADTFVTNQMEVDPTMCLGKGKLEQIQQRVGNSAIDMIIFSINLTARQLVNLNKYFSIPVEDRGWIILSIFDNIARTRHARLQVKIAQLSRQLPQLAHSEMDLDQQTGSSGGAKSRGKGEKNVEIKRRRLRDQLNTYQEELSKIIIKRENNVRLRERNRIPVVTIVGYSNVGKSTLMNRILQISNRSPDREVLADDRYFSSLETTSRRIPLINGRSFILADTVGLISDLPQELLSVFYSTLHQINCSELLLLVFDASAKNHQRQVEITNHYLEEIGALENIPCVIIFSKTDKLSEDELDELREAMTQSENKYPVCFISREDESSIENLLAEIRNILMKKYQTVTLFISYRDIKMYEYIAKNFVIYRNVETEEGIKLNIDILEEDYDLISPYIINQ